jgi:hypothetical protein
MVAGSADDVVTTAGVLGTNVFVAHVEGGSVLVGKQPILHLHDVQEKRCPLIFSPIFCTF